jgi:PAT family beta-lactamase induction signal transducer AmpG
MPAGSFAKGAAEAGVAPASLGAGYIVFFIYSCLVGVAALALALIIARREQKDQPTSNHGAAPA